MSSRPVRLRRAFAVATASTVAAVAIVGVPAATADPLDDGQWWRSAMGVAELHRSGKGAGITVALIDGPIDTSVPELEGRVASSTTACLAPGGGMRRSTEKGVLADHATSMASLIVGSGRGTASGGRGVTGIAPEATLRHYAVTFGDPRDPEKLSCGLEDPSVNVVGEATARAIRQAVKDGAKVLSLSLSTDYSGEYVTALLEAYEAGAIVVASTSNDTRRVRWPGLGNGVVTVTHVDRQGNLDPTATRRNSLVDFAAPGSDIATGAWTPSGWRSDVVSDGSSQATAITAGGLAALWSAHPEATGNQVLQAARRAVGLRAERGTYLTWFRRVGQNLPEATGKTESYGFGIVAPADAVKLDVDGLPTTNPMVADEGVVQPTAEEIAAVTPGAGASPSGSPSGSSSDSTSPSPSGDAEAAGPTTDAVEDEAGGGSGLVWLAVGIAVLAVLAALALALRRRAAGAAADGSRDTREAGTPGIQDRHDIQDRHGTHDTTAETDGVMATTKEHSNGGS